MSLLVLTILVKTPGHLLVKNCPYLSLSLMLRPTVSRPVCPGIKHPFGDNDQILITLRQLRVCWCRAFFDERTGLSFAIATGPRQRSHSRVRVPCDSRPYFTVSDSRLPFSLPPTTRGATVEVFDPTSTRAGPYLSVTSLVNSLSAYRQERTASNSSLSWKRHICCAVNVSVDTRCLWNQPTIWFQYSEVGCCVNSYTLPRKLLRESSRYSMICRLEEALNFFHN
jgi:hypothetical protein